MAAAKVGVNGIGLIFHQQSIRFVSLNQARALASPASSFPTIIGVFVNTNLQQVYSVNCKVSLNIMQFHGQNSMLQCLEFSSIIRVPWMYVLHMKSNDVLLEASTIVGNITTSFYPKNILLDTYSKRHGGSGRPFDWLKMPEADGGGIIISGGIMVSNVSKLLERGFMSLDVSSGVETKSRCGKKSLTRMKNMVSATHRTTNVVS